MTSLLIFLQGIGSHDIHGLSPRLFLLFDHLNCAICRIVECSWRPGVMVYVIHTRVT